MNAAMFKARVGNDYRSGFPVLATMGWILVFKGRCFLPEKEQTQTDLRTPSELEIYLVERRFSCFPISQPFRAEDLPFLLYTFNTPSLSKSP